MDMSITEFKRRCLEIVRHVEKTGRPVTIWRHGKRRGISGETLEKLDLPRAAQRR